MLLLLSLVLYLIYMIFFLLGLRYKAAVKADPLCYEVRRTVTQ
jgi:hypothetical protein